MPNIFKLTKSCKVRTAPVNNPVNPTTGIEQKPLVKIECKKFLKKKFLLIDDFIKLEVKITKRPIAELKDNKLFPNI